jgi:transcription antitermination factor NusG
MLWYVMRSKPNKEMFLQRELDMRGLECYYPQLHIHPVNPRSRAILPYFPGYLFIHTDLEQIGASIFQWMPHSLGLVSYGAEPAYVPDGLVNTIRRHLDGINAADGKQLEFFKRGEAVILQNGPFDGYEAIFDRCLEGGQRVRVFLKLLRARQLILELPTSQIQRKKDMLNYELSKS